MRQEILYQRIKKTGTIKVIIPALVVAAIVLVLLVSSFRRHFVAHIIREREAVKSKAAAMTLNHFIPSFDQLIDLNDGDVPSTEILREYVSYFEQVIEYYPHRWDAYGMLGFLYYYLAEYEQATACYEKAIDLNPRFFWSYYNVGLMFFKNSQYKDAGKFFRQAVELNPRETLLAMGSSKIYYQIKVGREGFGGVAGSHLSEGYENGYKLLLLSSYCHQRSLGLSKEPNDDGGAPCTVDGVELIPRIY